MKIKRVEFQNLKAFLGNLTGLFFPLSVCLGLFILGAAAVPASAQTLTITGYSLSPTNPLPGQSFQLSVTYCSPFNHDSEWEVALSNVGTTILGCPVKGQ